MAAATALAEVQPLSRYQSIIERQMFGMPPDGFDPNKNPNEVKGGKNAEKTLTEEQEKLQHSVRFSMINITPGGETAVGFTDNTDSKNPVHYYLKVGEKRNGWEVKEADPVRAWMKLAKGEVEVELELGGVSGASTAANLATGKSTPKTLPAQAAPATAKTTGMQGKQQGLLNGSGNSLRERRAKRAAREAEQRAKAEEEKTRLDEQMAVQNEEFKAMREEFQLQREEREFMRMEFERQREEDERRRQEEEQKREEKGNEENDT